MAETLTRRVVKATALLSSTQGINMVCSVVRMKLLAILVGPFGVGMVGALVQVTDTVGRLTQLNIRTTAVRDLAAATNASRYTAIRYSVVRYGRVLGLAGMAMVFVLAPWLSEFTFDTPRYAWAYRIVSATLLFQALQGTHLIILQAQSRYKPIAASSTATAVVGLILTVPLYLIFRVDGVAPSIVAYAMVAWLGALYFTRHDRPAGPSPTWRESLNLGREFIRAGALITVMGIGSDLINLGFMAYVQRAGDDTLGLFQAGYTMLWRYTGVFFMAYSLEFYPRLSRNVHSPGRIKTLLTHQTMVSIAMLLPCVLVVIPLAPWLLRLLYSADFLAATPYVVWGMAGMMFRPLSLAFSYAFLASKHNKTYCLCEILSALVALGCNVAGFHYMGFLGLGISTVILNAFDLAIMMAGARACGLKMPRARAFAATLAAVAASLTVAAIM